jgi:hypothetical protein
MEGILHPKTATAADLDRVCPNALSHAATVAREYVQREMQNLFHAHCCPRELERSIRPCSWARGDSCREFCLV